MTRSRGGVESDTARRRMPHAAAAPSVPGMAWLAVIPRDDAVGQLAETYAELAARPIPDAYQPQHDDAPGIVRAHSLDPELMRRAFSVSGSLHRSTLSWADRELISSVTARTNQCFY